MTMLFNHKSLSNLVTYSNLGKTKLLSTQRFDFVGLIGVLSNLVSKNRSNFIILSLIRYMVYIEGVLQKQVTKLLCCLFGLETFNNINDLQKIFT